MRSLLSRCLNISIGVLLLSPGIAIACPPPSKPALTCLPGGTDPNTIASAIMMPNGKVKQTTIQQTLQTLGASCKGKRLVDRQGREIRFFQEIACSGIQPPPEILKRWEEAQAERQRLKQRYTVIDLTCNTSGLPLP